VGSCDELRKGYEVGSCSWRNREVRLTLLSTGRVVIILPWVGGTVKFGVTFDTRRMDWAECPPDRGLFHCTNCNGPHVSGYRILRHNEIAGISLWI